MAAPTLSQLNFTEIDDADANTSWSNFTTADADIKKEGTNAMSGILRSDLDDGYYDDGTARTIAGKHFRAWINTINAPYMETETNNGYEVYVNDGTNTDYYTVFGSESYPGGWYNVVVDCSLFTTVTDASVRRWGFRCNHTSNAKNATNTWVDYFRYSDGYYLTGGTSGDKVRLSDVATADKGTTTLYGMGIVINVEGVFFAYGKLQIGNGSTTTYFEMDGDVLVFTDQPVADGLFAINGNGSGVDIVIADSTIKASGTGDDNRPDVDMSTDSPNSVSITDTVFIRGGTFTFDSGQTITGNKFTDCEQITSGGSDTSNCSIIGYEGTAGTGAFIWNENSNPGTLTTGMVFEKGTASTHAIQFGTSAATTITLTDMTFTSYNTSDAQNDSVLYFPDKGTDTTWTVNHSGTTGTVSYRKARSGDTVNITASVTITFTNLVNGSEVRVYKVSDDSVIDGVESVTGNQFAWSTQASTEVYYHVIHVQYEIIRNESYTVPGINTSLPIFQRLDRNYSNP